MVSREKIHNAGSTGAASNAPYSLAILLLEWRSPGGETAAVMCQDSPTDWWLAMGSANIRDRTLADSIADWAMAVNPGSSVSVDGPG